MNFSSSLNTKPVITAVKVITPNKHNNAVIGLIFPINSNRAKTRAAGMLIIQTRAVKRKKRKLDSFFFVINVV